jgi:hypothetical protein
MGRIQRTIVLAKASWQVLKADRELVLLPVLSLAATLVVAASFVVPILFAGDVSRIEDPGAGGYALLFAAYLVLTFITVFFNSALVHAANERLEGGDPTLGSAIRGASMRIGRIFQWALVAATVSLVLRALEDRAGAVGRFVVGMIGVAWSLVTFLVIPVIVVEGVGVGEAVKRAGTMFKRTWGENVAAQVGFGLLGMIAVIPAVIVAGLLSAVGGAAAVIGIVIAIAWVLVVVMTLSALSGIYQTVLYRYAAGLDLTNTPFDAVTLDAVFAPKRGGRPGPRTTPPGIAG